MSSRGEIDNDCACGANLLRKKRRVKRTESAKIGQQAWEVGTGAGFVERTAWKGGSIELVVDVYKGYRKTKGGQQHLRFLFPLSPLLSLSLHVLLVDFAIPLYTRSIPLSFLLLSRLYLLDVLRYTSSFSVYRSNTLRTAD